MTATQEINKALFIDKIGAKKCEIFELSDVKLFFYYFEDFGVITAVKGGAPVNSQKTNLATLKKYRKKATDKKMILTTIRNS